MRQNVSQNYFISWTQRLNIKKLDHNDNNINQYTNDSYNHNENINHNSNNSINSYNSKNSIHDYS